MLTLVADRVWDGRSPRPHRRGFVRIEGGRIDAVGLGSELPENADVRDFGNATILPGLINAHVHITFCASTTVLDDYFRERADGIDALTRRAEENLRRAISAGVTTVRDLGTLNDVVFDAQQRVREGAIPGPDIVAAGEGITSNGGHCYFFGIEAEGTDAVRAAVRRQHDAGADCIKVFATGGKLTPGTDPFAPQYSLDELRAVVDEARRFGLRVAAHAHATEGIRRSVSAGVNTIEHCAFETREGVEFDERTADEMARRGVVAVPTPGVRILRFLGDPSLVEDLPEPSRTTIGALLPKLGTIFKNFARMRELGVEVIAGTDAGIPQRHFDDFPADLALLAGEPGIRMGNHATLVAATSGCAAALGLNDRGALEAGRRADVLVVDGDPLEDITDLTRTRFVLSGGRTAVDHG